MEIILCKNVNFSFDTIHMWPCNLEETVVTLTPKCDIQLPPGISINSLTFEEKEYLEKVKEAGKKYHEKFGRHLCIDLCFPETKKSIREDRLKVHGFLWENNEHVEKSLRQNRDLKLRISLSISVLESRDSSGVPSWEKGMRLNTLTNPNVVSPKFVVVGDNSNATTGDKPFGAGMGNSLTKMRDTKENTTPFSQLVPSNPPVNPTNFQLEWTVNSPPFSLQAGENTTTHFVSAAKGRRARGGLDMLLMLRTLQSTPACCLQHLELPLNLIRRVATVIAHPCTLGTEYFTESPNLEFPENIRTFLTQYVYQSQHFFLNGIINVSLISNVAEHRRRTNELEICRNILQGEVESNVEIVADNGDVVFKCHKSFLSVHSQVLADEMKSPRIEMYNMSKQSVQAFLQYLYTGDYSKPNEDPKVALDLLKAAHEYKISPLERDMRNILNSKLDDWYPVEVTLDLFLFLQDVANSEDLKMRAIHVMKAQVEDIRMI